MAELVYRVDEHRAERAPSITLAEAGLLERQHLHCWWGAADELAVEGHVRGQRRGAVGIAEHEV